MWVSPLRAGPREQCPILTAGVWLLSLSTRASLSEPLSPSQAQAQGRGQQVEPALFPL